MTYLIHYWHEKDPPDRVVATLASFREHNRGIEQLVFDEASAEEFVYANHGGREAAAFRACAHPAMQADYFRCCAVHALGGIYADANFRCLRSLEHLIEGSERGVVFGRQDPMLKALAAFYRWPYPVGPFRVIVNGLFGFGDRFDPFLELALQAATANIENRVADGPAGVWVTTGPGVFTSIYLLHELGSIDAFLEYAAGSVIEPSARLFCEVVDDYARIAHLWDGLGIRPLEECASFCVKSPQGLESHWTQAEGSIYREKDGIYRERGKADDLEVS